MSDERSDAEKWQCLCEWFHLNPKDVTPEEVYAWGAMAGLHAEREWYSLCMTVGLDPVKSTVDDVIAATVRKDGVPLRILHSPRYSY